MRELEYRGKTFRIFGDEKDHYFSHNNVDPFYAKRLDFLDEESVVFDVGGNIGITSLEASAHNCTVYSFEPDPKAFGFLEKNCRENRGFKIFP